MQKTDNLTLLWNALKDIGCNDYGCAGMLGNVYAESAGCNPTCVEALLIQRYKAEGFKEWAAGSLYSQTIYDQYTNRVDSGEISKDEFLSPRQYTGKSHQYGYGICQWTTKARKEKLWSYTVSQGLSIGSIQGQIKLLIDELTNSYPKCLNVLKTADSVAAASDYILVHFESPANTDSLKATRRSYSKQIYDLFKGTGDGNVGYTASDVIKIAEQEIGYKEQTSNITKYWSQLCPSYQGEAWCDCFVSWCHWKASGSDKTIANQTLRGGLMSFYTPTSAQYYKSAGQFYSSPKVGDQIFFKNSSSICHTGIVTAVSRTKVTTIEGNTSDGTFDANGGAVCRKSYDLNSSRIAGYGRPAYSAEGSGCLMFSVDEIKKGDSGKDVKLLQRILKGNKRTGQNGEEIEVDGQFGDVTDYALKVFQEKKGLTADGICGENSWKTLLYR